MPDHPALVDGALSGPMARLVRSSGVNRELTACKRPSTIVILDALPASSAGKNLKHPLADAARGQASRRGCCST
jgi:acyl-CoA synthetase (AMP-forming)/AMP-acid ligase II